METISKRGNVRTLTYPLIKDGIKRAGPLPKYDDEPIMWLTWLSAAGYGKCCLASLRRYVAIRGVLAKEITVRYRSRGVEGLSQKNLPAALKTYGIAFPGKCANPQKRDRRSKRRGAYYHPETRPTLAGRLEEWQQWGGLTVWAAVVMHRAWVSTSRVIRVWSTEADKKLHLQLLLTTPHGPQTYEVILKDPPYTRSNCDMFNALYHFQTCPVNLPR